MSNIKVSLPTVLYHRRRILLAALAKAGGSMSKIRMQKLLFLFTCNQVKPAYYFLPYKYGCYSFQIAEDARILAEYYQLLTITENEKAYALRHKEVTKEITLRVEDEEHLDHTFKEYGMLSEEDLIYEVYSKYPYYAINSQLLKMPKFKPLRTKIREKQPQIKDNRFTLYTIGYEGKSIEQYMTRLIDNCVSALIDVRYNPFSMKWGFSTKQLQYITEQCEIEYIHIPELGIEGNLRKGLKSRADYERLFAKYKKTLRHVRKEKALREIQDTFKNHQRIALTCFEKEHTSCHRNQVAQAITGYCNIKVKHL